MLLYRTNGRACADEHGDKVFGFVFEDCEVGLDRQWHEVQASEDNGYGQVSVGYRV